MPDGEINDKKQHTFFNKPIVILVLVILFNMIISMLGSFFNFYGLSINSLYIIIIYYFFLLSCIMFFPVSIIGLDDDDFNSSISTVAIGSPDTVAMGTPISVATGSPVVMGSVVPSGKPE